MLYAKVNCKNSGCIKAKSITTATWLDVTDRDWTSLYLKKEDATVHSAWKRLTNN